MENNIKVVLLCHYWSDEMATMVGRKHYFRELSPWIQETLNLFKGKSDVELHVVAPNYASNTNIEVERDNIHYHFYHYSPTWLSRMVAPLIKLFVNHAETYKIAERFANTLTGFKTPAKIAVRIIHSINPDIIHLYGSENPDYAAPAVKLLGVYPILLTVQGYAYLQQCRGNLFERSFFNYRVKYEQQINREIKFVTVSENVSLEEYKNNKAHFFANCVKLFFVTAITKVPDIDASGMEKKYDVVYYARIDKNKGVEDLIEVVSVLKSENRPLKSLIMGRGGESYVQELKDTIKKKGINDLVNFAGFIENHEDVYKMAAQARVLVLPTHNDGIPNTIREAMFMKLPVVANNVGGIPTFNIHRKCVHLVECGDIQDLKHGILLVLDDENYKSALIENAFEEAHEKYSNNNVYDQLIKAYRGSCDIEQTN